MNNEAKTDIENTPTISRGSVITLLAFASVFGLIAVWPFAPPFDSLTKEDAHIQKVWKVGLATTTTNLITSTGRNVKCIHSKTGGCDPDTMKSLLEKNALVIVWHDEKNVYQLIAQDKIILPYEHAYQGRWFSGIISIISLLIALIQIAIRKGLIGPRTVQ